MKDNKNLLICKLKKGDIEQEFQGSGLALRDFEQQAVRCGWEIVFHRRA